MIMSDKHGRDHRANALDENLTIGDKIYLSFERTSEKITWKITKRARWRERKKNVLITYCMADMFPSRL